MRKPAGTAGKTRRTDSDEFLSLTPPLRAPGLPSGAMRIMDSAPRAVKTGAAASWTDRHRSHLHEHAELVAHDPFLGDFPVLQPELDDGRPVQLLLPGELDVASAAAEGVGMDPRPVRDAHGDHPAFGDQAAELGGKRGIVLEHSAQPLHRGVESGHVEAGTMQHDIAREELRQEIEPSLVEGLAEIALDDRLVARFLRFRGVRLRHAGYPRPR